jgi:hypothetical protein
MATEQPNFSFNELIINNDFKKDRFMNAKSLSILTLITLLVIIITVVLIQPKTKPIEKDIKVFPNLMSSLDDVAEIDVKTEEQTISLVRNDGQWLLKDKHNYPVALDKVRQVLFGTADLTFLEAKTSNPKLYSKIGVEDPSEAGAKSTLLTLKKEGGETLADLIIGNDKMAKTDTTLREIYIRKPNKKQTWLALGQLSVEPEPLDWVDKQIINLDNDRIRQVKVNQPDGEKILVFKDTPTDKEYQLAEVPAGMKIKFPYMLKNMATTLSYFNMTDVKVATEIEFNQQVLNAVFTTFDGLKVTLTTTEQDDKYYAKLAAEFDPEAVWLEPPKEEEEKEATSSEESEEKSESEESKSESEESKEDKPEDKTESAKPEVENLNAKFKGWVYEISAHKVEQLAKKLDELIEEEETETEEGDEELPVELGNPSTVTPAEMVMPTP